MARATVAEATVEQSARVVDAHRAAIIIVKPDGMHVGLDQLIPALSYAHGLSIAARQTVELTRELVLQIYADRVNNDSIKSGRLIRQMTCRPLATFLLEGEDALARVRSATFIGETHLDTGVRGWMKRTYYQDAAFWDAMRELTGNRIEGYEYTYNGAHASRTVEEVRRELSCLFPPYADASAP